MILICGCKVGIEVDGDDAPDEVRARASLRMGSHGRNFDMDTLRRSPGEIDPRVLVAEEVSRRAANEEQAC